MTTTIEIGKEKYHLQREMISWCQAQFDTDSRNWYWASSAPESWDDLEKWCISSAFGKSFFYFKNEADATMFALRWR